MLTRAEIDDILRLIDGSEFTELKLEMGELKLELRKGPQAISSQVHLGQNTPAGGSPIGRPCLRRGYLRQDERREPSLVPSGRLGRLVASAGQSLGLEPVGQLRLTQSPDLSTGETHDHF